ncbi:MAG: cell division protein FtsL [Deltaproteobacteria bacterium]|nr:cell division protein FtsL [Deltaproteobacteria bacterium]
MNRRTRNTRRRTSIVPWMVLFILFMAELLVYSWCRVQYVQTGYEVNQARKEGRRLLALQQALTVEEARLRSPQRIRRLAQNQGLVVPDSRQVVVLP